MLRLGFIVVEPTDYSRAVHNPALWAEDEYFVLIRTGKDALGLIFPADPSVYSIENI